MHFSLTSEPSMQAGHSMLGVYRQLDSYALC